MLGRQGSETLTHHEVGKHRIDLLVQKATEIFQAQPENSFTSNSLRAEINKQLEENQAANATLEMPQVIKTLQDSGLIEIDSMYGSGHFRKRQGDQNLP